MMPSIEKTPSVAISLKRAPAASASCSLRLQIGHVVVAVAEALRLAQADAVDDAGVVQLVADDRVLLAEQRLEQAAVGVEAATNRGCVSSVPRNWRQRASSSLCTFCVPQMKRTDAMP